VRAPTGPADLGAGGVLGALGRRRLHRGAPPLPGMGTSRGCAGAARAGPRPRGPRRRGGSRPSVLTPGLSWRKESHFSRTSRRAGLRESARDPGI
jgi:hypothetical protein